MMMIFFVLIISNLLYTIHSIPPSLPSQLYVVPFRIFSEGNADGSVDRPYTSIQQALDHIDTDRKQRIIINLYPTYHFVNTITFTEQHSRIRLTTMNNEIASFYEKIAINDSEYSRLPHASISGGIPITGWTTTGGNIYTATVPQPIFVNQLFANNQRVSRTRLPLNQSYYFQYAAPLQDPNQARYGFQYDRGQFENWPLDDAMVVVYHSWTTSHHYIDRIDTTNRTIFFTNPSNSPIGTYVIQGQRRFHVENLCIWVPNSFCFVNATRTIYLMTDGSYDPTKVQIITPVEEFVVIIAGTDVTNPVSDIIIDNVVIEHNAWNIARTEQADYQAASFLTSAALYIANATSIVISDVQIRHTGTYGVWIKEGTTNINLMNSLISDTGAGGVRVGQMTAPVTTPTSSIQILSNEISYGGNVFPSGVGLLIHRATDVVAVDNSIHHQRYTGVSVGWEWGYNPSYTSNILIHSNYIYNTGEHILCDQGGIYTLGIQPGTVISNNVIKNVFSYAAYMWGIYLDEGSSEIVVANNVVYNIGWAGLFQHYGANNTIINNVFARTSLITPPQPDDPIPDGDLRIMLTENHLSWRFINNIVYDTYQGTNHSIFKSDSPNVSVIFDSNIYYNPFQTKLLFGIQQTSFEEWQKTGQDSNSTITDPLFVGDVNQCDFFTVQSNSPAAKLGFKNITKLPKWSPGCGIDNSNESSNQFYHW
ncbi:unnamed protein product [Adineta ricciae]|uniref:Right handed beta helix domain-containing protein n=1 Tax=Adineta ricciae TaxID=249248 RepID=A0A815G367_ADIRI|nr:unnamed protein product [Adineta ricciae]